MSKLVDERVVEMSFDNKKFESNVKTSMKTIDELKSSLDFSGVTKSFSALEVAAVSAIATISNKLTNLAMQTAKSLTIDNVLSGWEQYAEQTKTIGSLVAQEIADEETIEKVISSMAFFESETSYSAQALQQGAANLATAGYALEDAMRTLEGLDLLVGSAGKGASDAIGLQAQAIQALMRESTNYMDWLSFVNRGVVTKEFKQRLLDTAVAMGTLVKAADGVTYKTTTKGNTFNGLEQFTEYLSTDNWLTKGVLSTVLSQYSLAMEEVQSLVDDETNDIETASQAIEVLITKYKELGDEEMLFSLQMIKNSQVARSLTDVTDSVKKAVAGGWKEIFGQILGDAEEATEMWTNLANELWEVFAGPVYDVLKEFRVWTNEGGRLDLFGNTEETTGALWNLINAYNALKEIADQAFSIIFPETKSLSERLSGFTTKFHDDMQKLVDNLTTGELGQKILSIFKGVFSAFKVIKTAIDSVFIILKPGFALVKNVTAYLVNAIANISEGFSNLTSDLSSFKPIAERIADTITTINGILEPIIFKVVDFVTWISHSIGSLIKSIGGFFGTAGEGIAEDVGEFASEIYDSVSEKFEETKDKLIEDAKSIDILGFGELIEQIKANISQAGEAIQKFFTENKIFAEIGEWFNEVGSKLVEIWGDVSVGFGTVIQWIRDTFNTILDEINKFVKDFESSNTYILLSKVFEDLKAVWTFIFGVIESTYKFITDTYTNTISPLLNDVITQLTDFFTTLYESEMFQHITETVTETFNFLVSLGKDIWGMLNKIWTEAIEPIIEFVKNIVTGTYAWIKDVYLDQLIEIVNQIFSIIAAVFNNMFPVIEAILNTIIYNLQGISDLITKHGDLVLDGVKKIGEWVQKFWTFVTDGIEKIRSKTKKETKETTETVEKTADVVEAVAEPVKETAEVVADTVTVVEESIEPVKEKMNGFTKFMTDLGNRIVEFYNRIKPTLDTIWQYFEFIFENAIMPVIMGIGNWFIENKPAIEEISNTVITPTLTKFLDIVSELLTQFMGFILIRLTKLNEFLSRVDYNVFEASYQRLEGIINALLPIADGLISLIGAAMPLIEQAIRALTDFVKFVTERITKTLDKSEQPEEKGKPFLTGLLNVLKWIGIIAAIILLVVKIIGDLIYAIKPIGSIRYAADAIGDFFSTARVQIFVNIFSQVAKAVLMLIAGIGILASLPNEELKTATGTVVGIFIMVAVFYGAIVTFASILKKIDKANPGSMDAIRKTINQLSLSFLMISASFLLLAGAVALVAKYVGDSDNFWEIFLVMIASLATVYGAFRLVTRKMDETRVKDMERASFTMLILAGALAAFAAAILMFKLIDWTELGKAGLVMGGILITIALMRVISMIPSKQEKALITFAASMAILAGALAAFAAAISLYTLITPTALTNAGFAMAGILATIAIMRVISMIPAENTKDFYNEIIPLLLAMVGVLLAVSLVLRILDNVTIKTGVIIGIIVTVTMILGGLVALIVIMKIFESANIGWLSIIQTFTILGVVVIALVAVFAALRLLDNVNINPALITTIGDILIKMVALVAILSIIGAFLAPSGPIAWIGLGYGAAILGVALLSILALVGILALLAGALKTLADTLSTLSGEEITTGLENLKTMLTTIAAFMAILGVMTIVIPTASISFGLFAVTVLTLAIAMDKLATAMTKVADLAERLGFIKSNKSFEIKNVDQLNKLMDNDMTITPVLDFSYAQSQLEDFVTGNASRLTFRVSTDQALAAAYSQNTRRATETSSTQTENQNGYNGQAIVINNTFNVTGENAGQTVQKISQQLDALAVREKTAVGNNKI